MDAHSHSLRDQHWPWLGFALEEALRHGVAEAHDVVVHATPEILVAQLPRDVTTQLLSRALDAGALSPASILETAPPLLLAEHLEPEVLWHCLADAAARAQQISAQNGSASDGGKRWLASILQRALDQALLTPADLLRFVPPAEFVRDAPLAVVAEIIRTGLNKGAFNPDLVLVHLTPKVIAENLQPRLAWQCIAEAATNKFELHHEAAAAPAPAPVIEAKAKERTRPDPTPMPMAPTRKDPKKDAAKIDPVAKKPAKPILDAPEWGATDLGEDVVEELVDEPPTGSNVRLA